MNFLVTGGAGFIGSHVCERLLHSGHAVWASDDLNPFYDPRLKQRNLRDLQSLAKPFEFVRVDLYDLPDGVYFSEFTFTPNATLFPFRDPAFSRKLLEDVLEASAKGGI